MTYLPNTQRYHAMQYRRCGRSGLQLPAVSLGLWHNFGHLDVLENCRDILHLAFDAGITHFDLANNYGPPPGSAEENFGRILRQDFQGYRDELVISTKAGYHMWEGPYGEWGSKKYLVSSLDQSLRRMGLDYVDIFYSHRPDPDTPLEETMSALDLIVRQGKALYVGISNYQNKEAERACQILKELGTPCLIHQPKYSMFERWIENGLLVLSVGARAADQQIFRRHSGGFACCQTARLFEGKCYHGRPPTANPCTQRPCPTAWPDIGANGAGLGIERPAHHLRPRRREQARAISGFAEMPRQFGIQRGRVAKNRGGVKSSLEGFR
jgi:diketogulonate reductase-like aldo/keto reductase